MKAIRSVYIFCTILLAAVVCYAASESAAILVQSGEQTVFLRFGMVTVFLAVSRSLPQGERPDGPAWICVPVLLSVAMLAHPLQVIAAHEVSTLLTFVYDTRSGKRRSALAALPLQTLFSDAVMILALYGASMAYQSLNGGARGFQWPASLIPACIITVLFCIFVRSMTAVFHWMQGRARSLMTPKIFLFRCVGVLAAIGFACLMTVLFEWCSGLYLLLPMLVLMWLASLLLRRYVGARARYFRVLKEVSDSAVRDNQGLQLRHDCVEQLAVKIGRTMHLSAKRMRDLRIAARLYDIGKVGMDDMILRKAEPLDPLEWESVRRHPEIGCKMVEQLALSSVTKAAIRHHHERYDGGGYPDGLALGALPLEAAILSVADAFSAMTCDRPFQQRISPAQALAVLREEAGKQFHPDVVRAFARSGEVR